MIWNLQIFIFKQLLVNLNAMVTPCVKGTSKGGTNSYGGNLNIEICQQRGIRMTVETMTYILAAQVSLSC